MCLWSIYSCLETPSHFEAKTRNKLANFIRTGPILSLQLVYLNSLYHIRRQSVLKSKVCLMFTVLVISTQPTKQPPAAHLPYP